MFLRLGPWCHDHRRLVLGIWIGLLVLIGATAGAVGSASRDEFSLPNVESRRGFDILDAEFGGQGAGQIGTIVFRAEQGVTDPEVQQQMEAFFAEVAAIPDVVRVESPYVQGGPPQIALQGPEAGKIAFANVEMPDNISFVRANEIGKEIERLAPQIDGVEIELGGQVFASFEPPSSEVLGLAFAIIILIVAFGSVLAMGLPVGNALFGIGIGVSIITLLTNVLPVPDFTTFLGIMIGLGVGIDYALLIVTRYREQLHAGHAVRESIGTAIDTAGRSVLFAGTTVVISLMGLLLMGVKFVQGLSVGAAAVVAVTVAASLTLLPALLGFAGERIERTQFRGLIAALLDRTRTRGRRAAHPCAVGGVRPRRDRAGGRLLRAFAEAGGAQGRAEAAPTDHCLSVEPSHPAPSVDGRDLERARAPPARRPGPELATRLLGREQLRGRHDDAQGLRPARRRLRSGLQRPVAARCRSARGHRRRGAVDGV